jgi:integrase
MASAERITGTKFWRGRYRCGGTICTGSCKSGHVGGLSYDADGNRFRSRAKATKAATLREDDVQKSARQINADRTFKDAALKFCDTDREGVAASTTSGYREQTRSFFAKFPAAAGMLIADVTTDHIDAWLIAIRDRGLRQNPINNYRTLLHVIFKHAERKKWVTANPVLNADTPTSIHKTVPVPAFTEDELNRLADAIDPRYSLLVLVGGYSGLRIGELIGLREADLIEHIDGGLLLHVSEQFQDGEYTPLKTGKSKTVPVAAHVVPILRQHLINYPPSKNRDGNLFTTKNGLPLEYHNFVARVWQPAIAAAGVPALGTHSMRHHFADYCRDRGVPIEVTADWGGWSSPRMLEEVYRSKNSEADIDKYAHLLASDRDEQTDDQAAAS